MRIKYPRVIYVDNRKTANIFTFKLVLFLILFIVVFILISRVGYISAGQLMFPNYNAVYTEKVTPLKSRQIIVIDPGHGGPDNGATGINGANEKDINLCVSKMVGEILSVMDFDVKYTRTEDISPGNTDKFIKRTDLSYRVKLARGFDDPIFLSIHMNKFGIEKYSGAQTFFSKNNPSSEILAIKLQRAIRQLIQPDNNREVKKAGSSIFILDRLEIPAVLCECGFLSNSREAELLTQPQYQKKLAFSIAMGVVDYFKKEEL